MKLKITFIVLASRAIGSAELIRQCRGLEAAWGDPSVRVFLFRLNVDNIHELGFIKIANLRP